MSLTNEQGSQYLFFLNAHGLPERQRAFDGQEMRYEFDAARRVTRILHSDGAWSSWDYDPMSRVTKTVWRDGTIADLAYDAAGATQKARNADTLVTYERDVLGRVVRELQGESWIATTYDDEGRIVAIETSLGFEQRIERDARGRTVSISVSMGGALRWAALQSHGPDGVVTATFPGDVRTEWQHDAFSRPLRHSVSVQGRTHSTREYVWGAELRLRELKDSQRGTLVFEYDEFDRLAGFTTGDGTYYPHRMDSVGNLIFSGPEGPRVYGAAGEILASDRCTYRYDGRGRRIHKEEAAGSWSYTWLDSGMLSRVDRPDGRSVEFTYDALAAGWPSDSRATSGGGCGPRTFRFTSGARAKLHRKAWRPICGTW